MKEHKKTSSIKYYYILSTKGIIAQKYRKRMTERYRVKRVREMKKEEKTNCYE